MKFRSLLSVFGLIAAVSLSALPMTSRAQVNKGLPVVELSIKNSKLKAEVVADNATRSIGLMNRFSLAPDHGMLFVFAQSEPLAFWMKNTFVPLSIAYVDSKGVIVTIVDMKPHDESAYPSGAPAISLSTPPPGWRHRKKWTRPRRWRC